MKKESQFQHELIKELEIIFPGCKVMKNDAQYRPGFPDLTVFYKDRYALLECKRNAKEASDEKLRFNQKYYISYFKEQGGLAYFVYPENKEEVIHELSQAFGVA